jgi:hypothetical protein
LLELFVQECLKFVLIVGRDHTIVEDSQDLVAPKLDQVLFGVLVGFLGLVKTSEHFADVSHVEHVVGALGRGQELLRNVVEELDRSNGKRLADSLDLIREVVELELCEVAKDLLQVLLRWVGVLDYVEVAHDAVGDVLATTTGLAHCCHQLHVADVVLDDLRAVVPEAIVHMLADKLDRRLGAEFILHRHVQVINDTDCLQFGTLGLEPVLGAAVIVRLDDLLHAGRGRARREIDRERKLVGIKRHQNLVNQDCLANTGLSDQKHGLFCVQKLLNEESVPHSVHGRHNNLVELLVDGLDLIDPLLPAVPLLLLRVDEVLIDSVAVGEHRLNISHDNVDVASALLIYSGAN